MKKWIYNSLIIFFASTLLISIGALGYYYISGYLQQSRYRELSQLMGEETTPRPTLPDPTDGSAPSPTVPAYDYVTVTDPETGEDVQLLPEFKELYLLNNDIVGWIFIPDTQIDYPVMQTPDSPDYYLKRNFDKASSARGCIYVREQCDVFAPSDNVTIYGHRMKSGAMFGQLDKYFQYDFYDSHRYIYFDTLKELHTYEILAVFLTTASQGEGFAYHMFVDAQSEEEFTDYVNTCKRLSFYDTGVEAAYGDSLITLSTCEYSQPNGRLVVVAKRIS